MTSYNLSTVVTARGGDVVCERATYGPGRAWATDSLGAETPAVTWYLPEGSTDGGMETWVLVQNPGAANAKVTLSLQTSEGPRSPAELKDVIIPAGTRRSFRLNDYVTTYNVSTTVSASGGVVCERATYGPGRAWATGSLGAETPAVTWYLPEGSTDGGMETWVLVQNPGAANARVTLSLQTSEGPRSPAELKDVIIPAGTRRSFRLNDYVTTYNVSTTVSASGGVVCERATYGPGRAWATGSLGAETPAVTWYLPEGSTDGGMETWVLVQNPGAASARVTLSLQTSEGPRSPAELKDVIIPAGTRRSFRLNDYVTTYNVSTTVSASGGVVCERATYGPGRAWAQSSIAYAPR